MVKGEKEVEEFKKRDYVNFKQVIWHDLFYKLLDSIQAYSQVKFHINCVDRTECHLYPVILILSANYEEQYEWLCIPYLSGYIYNSFILGVSWYLYVALSISRLSCPTCPGEWLVNTPTLDIRKYEGGLQVAKILSKTEQEKLLKKYELKNVEIWEVYYIVIF